MMPFKTITAASIRALALLSWSMIASASSSRADEDPGRWHKTRITVAGRFDLSASPGSKIPPVECLAILGRACDSWSRICGITLALDECAGLSADILVVTGRVDGPGGAWGQAQFPREAARLTVIVDVAEAWDATSMERLLRHEIGHCLGLTHSDESIPAVMNPHGWADAERLAVLDMGRVQEIYGLWDSQPLQCQPPARRK